MNILWVITTQWRAQACGYAGDANVRTPTLDRLAMDALNFSEAVTPHPFGPFARAALLTGRPSPANGVADYFDPLPEDAITIVHRLNRLGYATGFFGKWHLARRDPTAPLVGLEHAQMQVPPRARGGFSFWEGFESGFQLIDPWLHGTALPEPTRFRGYQSDVVFERAERWIDSAADKPWFAIVSLEPPHPPYAQVPGFVTHPGETINLRDNVPAQAAVQARRELAGYYAQIEATDAAFGKFLQRIDFSDTMIVFTSVHGDMHGSQGEFRKGWPYEESIRVPLLVHVPHRRPAIRRDAISLLNLPALTLAWAASNQVQQPQSLGAEALISMPSVVPFPQQCDRTWRGIRSRRRKLILNADDSPWLFFDLENDPGEQDNLVGEAKMQQEMEILKKELDVFSGPEGLDTAASFC